jgi:arylsulfatase A
LQAVRSGKWKLHLEHEYDRPDPPGHDGKPGKYAKREIGPALFDLETDLGETNDLAVQHPEVVIRLKVLAEKCREDLGDSATGQEGKNVRPPGRLEQK